MTPHQTGASAILIIALVLIIAGSFTGAGLMWAYGAGPWQIALGYVGGGWAGLLTGMPVVLLVQMVHCRLSRRGDAGDSRGKNGTAAETRRKSGRIA